MNLQNFLSQSAERFDEKFSVMYLLGEAEPIADCQKRLKSFFRSEQEALIALVVEEIASIDWRNAGLGNTPYDKDIINYYEEKLSDLKAAITNKEL